MPDLRRRHYCWNCGKDMGVWDHRYCRASDTCGALECEKAAREAERDERARARERRDFDEQWDRFR